MPASRIPPPVRPSPLSVLLRDLTHGLYQQMFFLGRDVIHPDGNLLLARNFGKFPSSGLKGTSCYGRDWQGGRIELHGACAGWYPASGREAFLFVRPLRRCFIWTGDTPVVPGEWCPDFLESADPGRLRMACLPFLDWWLDHEEWVLSTLGRAYRQDCHAQYRRVPKARPWLPPAAAMAWLRGFRDDPARLRRAKRLSN